ncbi:MAG: chromosomal replication initiator protein DnaA [Solirubrobacterales bacterium]|nr:chromosomal replication initiator protein DnaA [Solirubrobacterales bacterium]
MTPDPALIWERIQEELRQAVPASMYDIWLEPLRLVEVDGSALVLEAPRELHAWVADRFSRVLQTCSAAVLGEEVSVDVRAGGSSARPRQGRHADARRERAVRAAPAPEADTVVTERLNAKYTFDQFVIGDANRFAHAAALAVAELPGQAYNPLFIYGPPGVGKTHLLHSIGNYVRAYGGGLSVRYTTVETFTNQFVQALRNGSVEQFKGRYRRNDVLLIDDVQFLQSKAKTEEEFFHTFNALYEIGSQLVLTSDRLPRDLDALEDRLCERFESGLVTDIQAPDHATRMTVLRKRVQHDGIAMTDEAVLEAIAERVPTNIRALEGALIRVVAFSSLTGRPLSPDLAGEVLGELYPGAAPQIGASRISVEQIQELTAAAFGLTRDELLSDSRVAGITWPRQVAMYLAREHTDATLPAIGRSFGGRNHTTVMHACRRAAQRLAADPEAFEIVRRLTDELGAREQDAPGARRPDRRG